MNNPCSGSAVAKSGTFGRSKDQHDAENIKRRESIHYPQDVADHAAGKPRLTAIHIDNPQSESPFAHRGPGPALEKDIVQDDDHQKDDAQRIGDKPTVRPLVIGALHQPDTFHEFRNRKEHGAKEEHIDYQGPKTAPQAGVLWTTMFHNAIVTVTIRLYQQLLYARIAWADSGILVHVVDIIHDINRIYYAVTVPERY